MHLIIAIIYSFIAYREWRIAVSEAVELKPNGITIPDFFGQWQYQMAAYKKSGEDYNSIIIETVRDKKVQFQLRHNLKIEELQQINDFCSVHSQLSN